MLNCNGSDLQSCSDGQMQGVTHLQLFSVLLLQNSFARVILLVLCLGVTYVVYQTKFHPLAAFPGPLSSKLSQFPAVYHAICGTRHQRLYEAHHRYGAVIRCGPNHVSINDASALTPIYGAKANVRKSIWYTAFFGESVFNTRNKNTHLRKKHAMAHAFSQQSVQEVQPAITEVIRDWCAALGDDGKRGPTWSTPKNMSHWSAHVIFDSLGSLLFGQSFNTTRSEEQRPFLELMANNIWFLNIMGQMPALQKLGLPAIFMREQGRKLAMRLAFARKLLQKRISLRESHARPRDLVHYLMQARDPETGKGYEERELISEINLLLVAGSDTTNTALASLWYFLAHKPDVLSRLTGSIRDQYTEVDAISSAHVVSSIPYLKACVDEALRLCPPVPMLLPREVQQGGLNVLGHHFPAGTVIGVPTYTLHHNEKYFRAPFEYDPDRWMAEYSANKDPAFTVSLAKQRDAFVPFSTGPRACMGRHVALLELCVVVARVLFDYDLRLTPGSEKMGTGPHLEYGIRDYFIVGKDGPLLQFRRRI